MAEGRDRQLWGHTSWLLAMIANVNRDPKKSRAFEPIDFNPYMLAGRRRRGPPKRGIPVAGNIEILKSLLPSGKGS